MAEPGARRGIWRLLPTWERLGRDEPADRTASASFVRYLFTREKLDRPSGSDEPPRPPRFLRHLIARESLDEEVPGEPADRSEDSRSGPH